MKPNICSRVMALTVSLLPATSLPIGLARPHELIEYHAHPLLRGIEAHIDLLDDHLPFLIHILRTEERVAQQVH